MMRGVEYPNYYPDDKKGKKSRKVSQKCFQESIKLTIFL